MCLTVLFEAFLLGIGGAICVGYNFLIVFLNQIKSLYLRPTSQPKAGVAI